MFGEYHSVGLTCFLGCIVLTPMSQGLDQGRKPQCFRIHGWCLSPSICFESTVPHLIRQQVETLRKSNSPPDLLVNVTNDGWFWGSNILDLQLACAVFRAIENRLPVIGRRQHRNFCFCGQSGAMCEQQGPRRSEAILYAEIRADDRLSWYRRIGDVPAGLCVCFCLAAAVFGVVANLSRNKAGINQSILAVVSRFSSVFSPVQRCSIVEVQPVFPDKRGSNHPFCLCFLVSARFVDTAFCAELY